jgi:hypothetical protein
MKSWHLAAFCAGILISTSASAEIIVFALTGKYTLLNPYPYGEVMDQQSISSTLTYDTSSASGTSPTLTINNFVTYGATASIHNISLQAVSGTNYIVGNMLADWSGTVGIPISMVWDATGLNNAIEFGLNVGDVISGTDLIRNGNVVYDVSSATPASDGLYFDSLNTYLNQGPAPLAMTTLNTTTLCTPGVNCMGNAKSGGSPFTDDGIAGSPMIDGPFPGLNVNFDIGSGHSLTVLSITSVPLPGAAWLLASGLLGLGRIARHKKLS